MILSKIYNELFRICKILEDIKNELTPRKIHLLKKEQRLFAVSKGDILGEVEQNSETGAISPRIIKFERIDGGIRGVDISHTEENQDTEKMKYSVKSDIQNKCEGCPGLEMVTRTKTIYEDEEPVESETVIACKNERLCNEILEHFMKTGAFKEPPPVS